MNIKICVIGAGRWGTNHIKTLSGLCVEVGIVEKDPKKKIDINKSFPEISCFDSLKEAFQKNFDGYIIATPPITHFEIAKNCLEKNKHDYNGTEIDYRRIFDYNLGPAIFLVIMMALYAITLRPLGFFISTITFLAVSGYVLGERKIVILFFVAASASFIIWYLVEQVLGIYLRPLPTIF